jgi:hypothetical protein
MSKDPRALSPDIVKPYIDAGAIEQREIDAFEEGGQSDRWNGGKVETRSLTSLLVRRQIDESVQHGESMISLFDEEGDEGKEVEGRKER